MLWAVMGTVRRPNATFGEISRDPGRYLASSVAVFAIVCLASVLQSATAWFVPNGAIANFSDSVWHAASLVNLAVRNFLIIAMMFWIGGWHGKNRRFKDTFPMLSYCLVPMVFMAAAFPAIDLLDVQAHMHGGGYYLGGGSLVQDPDLSPSPALDFAGNLGIRIIQTAFTGFFMAWAFVLFVKAAKTSHGFGTGRAVGVVALAAAATFALVVALGMATAVLGELFLPPHLP